MEGISIIIPVFNRIEITLKCINHIREFNQCGLFEILIVDNGSTDKTSDALSCEKDITYLRNPNNIGLSKAYNYAGRTAKYDTFCFMHNDVFVFEKDWAMKIKNFIENTPDAGIVGLYGAKTIRRDGSFRGKTIVHSIKESPSIRKPSEKVAVVDGLLMAMHKKVFKQIQGFNEVFAIHFYDKDISLLALKNNYFNYVLNIPFEHCCGSTRKTIAGENKVRDEARKQFVEMWQGFLPVDVTTWRERMGAYF